MTITRRSLQVGLGLLWLLDGALHAVVLSRADNDGEMALPFSWQKVSLHAAGASAVRARIAPSGAAGTSAVSIELSDGLGMPVLSVSSMCAEMLIVFCDSAV